MSRGLKEVLISAAAVLVTALVIVGCAYFVWRTARFTDEKIEDRQDTETHTTIYSGDWSKILLECDSVGFARGHFVQCEEGTVQVPSRSHVVVTPRFMGGLP